MIAWLWLSVALGSEVDSERVDELVEMTRRLERAVEERRGLALREPVTVDVQTPAEATEMMRESFEEDLDEVRKTDRVYRAFGLVPAGFDLEATLLGMFGTMLGGYYEPEERALFLVERPDWSTGPVSNDEVVAVHELVHGVQDQHFDLWTLTEQTYRTDDAALATRAVVEGDASLLEARWVYEQSGLDPDTTDRPDLLTIPPETFGRLPPGAPPLVLLRSLTFPYSSGHRFVRAVYEARGGWDGINALYEDMPISTEQILHPEKYLDDRDHPHVVPLGAMRRALGKGWRQVADGDVGELGLEILYTHHLGQHARHRVWAEGWDGDAYIVYEQRTTEEVALVWRSCWDSEADASEFAGSLGQLVGESWCPECTAETSPDGLLFVSADDPNRIGVVETDGLEVLFLWGVPVERREPIARKAWRKKAFEVQSISELTSGAGRRPKPKAP